VLVAFTDRRGGVSKPPYDTLNLALRGGDDPENVTENRRRAAAAADFEPRDLALARQVHGGHVITVGAHGGMVGQADGLVAEAGTAEGLVLGILSADCAAVALAGAGGVALVHAGWRGLVEGIVATGVAALGSVWGAWVGPAIKGCCYEVGPEVIEAFGSAGLPVADEHHIDIEVAATHAARRAGAENVETVGECTCCDERYFSYRRDGLTGRQGAFAGLL
jgi:polyphenol oxidase